MIPIKENISLREKSSFRIGGVARYYVRVHRIAEVKDVCRWAREHEQPLFILGRGSNILISDAGWPGLVLDMSGFTEITWHETIAVCQSGALLHTLVKQSVDRGFGGMEELAGIPGSVGGALVMNAGAFTQTVSECLVSVKGVSVEGTGFNLGRSDINFGYRTSSFKQESTILLEAEFLFVKQNKEQLLSAFTETLKKRNRKQPLDTPNCGSVFKRPAGYYAGALIEECGLKGYTIGGAMVAPKHANFILNSGSASAEDVRKLIVHIQRQVYNAYGILLEPEVVFVGDFYTPLFEP